MKTFILALFVLSLPFTLMAQPLLKTRLLTVKLGLSLRVGEVLPQGAIKGDILYFHGFGDRLDNHLPLFRHWAQRGFRVLGFDLPSHGESTGVLNNIDYHSFREILSYAETIEDETRKDLSRPLILAGWSTGGLLAIRGIQQNYFAERAVAGLILFAPAVSVPALVGKKGVLTQETLTSNPNPPHMGEIRPISPLLKPIFASKLITNATAANLHTLPLDLPVMMFVGGEKEDHYVKTKNVEQWFRRDRQGAYALRVGVKCSKAYHELDNEPYPVGNQVRELAVEFSEMVVGERKSFSNPGTGPCRKF